MNTTLVLPEAPALYPAWIEYEKEAGLIGPTPLFQDYVDRQVTYSQACKARNAQMLAGRDKYLAEGMEIADSSIKARDGQQIPIRVYIPSDSINGRVSSGENENLIIYYHGGGLKVGDLDSEDLSCRRICEEARVIVASVEYRLAPPWMPQKCLDDAYDAFLDISAGYPSPKRLILVGSSSGGQLAAQVAQLARDEPEALKKTIDGMLLRCPVTVDASDGGIHIPKRFRSMHTSFTPSFETSLLKIYSDPARDNTPNLPLEAESFHDLPPTWIQVCTNDLYYSDGICYATALREAGVEIAVKVVHGWPHTFWLKAPQLDKALEADMDMIEGLKWLIKLGDGLTQ
jgi:acetyl esterase/lipase